MAIANQNPQNVLNHVVEFSTTDLLNGNTFEEPHYVSSPTPGGTFNINLGAFSLSSNKMVVPLSTNTSQGSYWLKLHKSQPNSSMMYVTFAQKNSSMADGYYDYQTGIPSDFRAALRTWIRDNEVLSSSGSVTRSKTLLFDVYGLDTNSVSSATPFRIRFNATFSGNVSSTPVQSVA